MWLLKSTSRINVRATNPDCWVLQVDAMVALMNIILVSTLIAIGFYCASSIVLGMQIARGTSAHTPGMTPPVILALIGLVLHAVALQQGILLDQGMDLGFFNVLSLIGWTIVLVLIIAALFEPVINIGVVMFPGAAVTMVLMLVLPAERIVQLQGGWPMSAHVLLSFLAYSLFALAAVQVILLAFQDQALRQHKVGRFIRTLPPLQTMEAVLFQMLMLGFVLLTLSLLTGAFYIKDMFAQHLIHKTILSLVSWLVFGTLLWGRWKFGWRGRRALFWTLSGFITLGLAYPVTKFILEVILGRSWS